MKITRAKHYNEADVINSHTFANNDADNVDAEMTIVMMLVITRQDYYSPNYDSVTSRHSEEILSSMLRWAALLMVC